MTCEHTFGLATFANQDWLVVGARDFSKFTQPAYRGGYAYLTPDNYFAYCPDCGTLLAPIIAEINILADAIKRVFPK